MIESSMSTSTRSVVMPATTGVREASEHSTGEATASSCRTWPKVKVGRNDPHVDGAYG